MGPNMAVTTPQQVVQQQQYSKAYDLFVTVDNRIKQHIAAGEYVELGKLGKGEFRPPDDKDQLDAITKGERTYYAPPEGKMEQIKDYAHWERCWKVYAGIFVENSPHRAVEIIKYSHQIETAASKYKSSEMADYDMKFRANMHHYPTNNWGVQDTALWNMCLTTLITNQGSSSGGGRDRQGDKK